MKDVIKSIIKDFHRRSLPKISRRELAVPINSGKIISIVGSRRAGKTYYLYQVIGDLIKRISKENIIYINFEDERLNLNSEDLKLIIESYYELYPDNTEQLYFFFDEIQNISDWEKFVRRIYDTISKNIFVTGSSSKLLIKEISTSLRGRSISYELFPLSFSEYLIFRSIDPTDIYSTRNKSRIVRELNSFLNNGGFPEVVNYDYELRSKTLLSYFDVMIYRDIIDRFEVTNPVALKYIIKKSLINISTYLSVNKMYNELKSLGVKVSKDSIYLFLNYIQDCYLLFLIKIYSESINVQNINDKKIYCIDNGLANNLTFALSENRGRLLENAVYLFLRSSGYQLYYFADNRECDFVIHQKSNITSAIQVTDSLIQNNKKREIEGILEAMKRFDLKKGTIVTFDQAETLKIENKTIEVIPAWKFFLTK